MKIAVKLFAVITVAFGLKEATKPEQNIDYSEEMAHSQKVLIPLYKNCYIYIESTIV